MLDLPTVPVVVMGNKIDRNVPNMPSEEQLASRLGILHEQTGKKLKVVQQRPLELFMTSVKMGANLKECLEWIAYYATTGK